MMGCGAVVVVAVVVISGVVPGAAATRSDAEFANLAFADGPYHVLLSPCV